MILPRYPGTARRCGLARSGDLFGAARRHLTVRIARNGHPAKFPEEIQKAIGIDPELPDSMKDLDEKTGEADLMTNDYSALRHYLLSQLKKKN